MDPSDPFSHAPARIPSGLEGAGPGFSREPGHYAVHGWRGAATDPPPVAHFADEEVAVLRGAPGADAEGRLGPVYRAGAGGALAVPTGRVFIRFDEGDAAAAHAEALRQAGYEVEQAPDYAPHAAWLRPRSGDPAQGLAGLAALGALPGVRHVEPQLLMERATRG